MPEQLSIPVLCYHSWRLGAGYGDNDHIALAADLRTLAARGYQPISLTAIARLLRAEIPLSAAFGKRLIGISFDDGHDSDFYSFSDTTGKPQPAMVDLLAAYAPKLPRWDSGPMATSFVIASSAARQAIDQHSQLDPFQRHEQWWSTACDADLLGVANHSWDHTHPAVAQVRQRENQTGNFWGVDTFADAEGQIAAAQHYLIALTQNRQQPLFAYPYGEVPEYLAHHYLPEQQRQLGLIGAYSTAGSIVDASCSPWFIPRLVCGWHWCSEQDFARLLDENEARLCSMA